jgi:hypothetical protein
MMRGCHEPCQGWIAKNGVVWQRDVGDVEVEALGPVVVLGAEGNGQAYLPNWCCRTFGYPKEWSGWHEPMVRHLHLLEDLDRDDVEARPPSMRVRFTAMLLMVGMHKRGIVHTPLVEAG